jgi:flagellar basal body rod protein FlgG
MLQAAAAMNANARWQEIISENLAAASIPGFKRQDASFDAVQAGFITPTAFEPAKPLSMPRANAVTNFQQGPLRATGVKTDVALAGPGFFEVQLANGATAYTRNGEFQVNPQGQMVTKQGYLVLGEGGPIQLDPNNPSPLWISPTGEISQVADPKGKLKIHDFDRPELLTAISGGCFLAENPSLQGAPVQQPSLQQGFLEGGNSSVVTEMANLITSMRGFEANQKVLQLHDERMGKVISELGHPG